MKSVCNSNKDTLSVCLAIGLIAGGLFSASAQPPQDRGTDRPAIGQRQRPGQRPGTTDARQPGMRQGDPTRQGQAMMRASKLLDMEVHGQDGRKLGDVEEIILSQDRRSVEHVKVALDDGDRVKLSLDELSAKPDDDNALLVRASKQDLQQRQTKDRDQARGGREKDDYESRQVSKLIGLDVKGTDDKDVGSISDLIIDPQSGRIETVAVQTGGFFGLRTRLASMDWQQVNVAADGKTASTNTTKDRLSEGEQRQEAFWSRHASEGADGRRERTMGMQGGRHMDQKDATMTSFDQGNSKADTDATARIRKEVSASENMSVSGKNVTIITKDGRVTLRGQVDNAEEKQLIGEIANRVVRSGNVTNQLEVKPTTTTTTRIE